MSEDDENDLGDDFICDGCAQLASECLCDIDIEDVLDCASIYHPGCRLCEIA